MNQSNLLLQSAGAPALIDPAGKGLGALPSAVPASDIAKLNWSLLQEDLSLPVAVLYEERLMHNLQWMQQFLAAYRVNIAPHGKTTMAPKLFALQMHAGAWGITLATAPQTRVAYEHGVRRVLMANQLVGRQNMATIANLLQDPEFEFFCLVDSARQVELLGAFFEERKQKLSVLLELGVEGGRTGIRTPLQLQSLLESLKRYRETIILSGVEIYEGILEDEASVRVFLHTMVKTARALEAEKLFDRTPVILSGAGSAWYDIVAEEMTETKLGFPIEPVLRPGCYLTHDGGIYKTAQEEVLERNPIAQGLHPGLKPALHLWAYVQSIPETGKAIISLGKRDASFDSGLPLPALHYRPGRSAEPLDTPAHWKLTKMMDQHAFMQIAGGDDIAVGDMVAFNISHPCLTFDKWRTIPILDDSYRVIDIVQTYF